MRGSTATQLASSTTGCGPNCGTQVWTVGSQQRVGIFALRDIEQGEELTYNYRAQTFNARGQHNNIVQACRCGASNCSSFLGEKPAAPVKAERKKRKTSAADSGSRASKGRTATGQKRRRATEENRRPAARPSVHKGEAQPLAKKSTGFGHGVALQRRAAVKQREQSTVKQDEGEETEDEDDAAAADGAPVASSDDSGVKQEQRDEGTIQQQQQYG